MVTPTKGRAHVGTFSFDEHRSVLELTVKLGRHSQAPPARVERWLAFNGERGLCRIDRDPADGVVWLRAVSVCKALNAGAAFVAKSLAEEVCAALENDSILTTIEELDRDSGLTHETEVNS